MTIAAKKFKVGDRYICNDRLYLSDFAVNIGDICKITAIGQYYVLIYVEVYQNRVIIERFEEKICKEDMEEYFTENTNTFWAYSVLN